jgi:phenylalanyl-tRNA synthetase beta chain
MKFSYNWLQSYFEKKLPPAEKLAELLTMHAFEIESVKKTLRLGSGQAKNDWLLDVKILPNRMPDASGHIGLARECAAITGLKFKDAVYKGKKASGLKTSDYVKIKVSEPKLCPRYIGLLVDGVKVAESPAWLKERLLSVGQKSISNIVDIMNFVMLETGQPLHSFDLEKIGGRTIVVRRAKEGEKMRTLDNRDMTLKSDMLVIADAKEPMAIAGIKGGANSGIDANTSRIIIEAAIFNPASIRKTSRNINLKTDASLRFEHGLSLSLAETGVWRAAALVSQIAGGKIANKAADVLSEKIEEKKVIFSLADFSKITGFEIKQGEVERIFGALGFKYKKQAKGIYTLVPPLERTDISLKQDIVEELSRISGYDFVTGSLPKETIAAPAANDLHIASEKAKNILVGMGFSEIYGYSFVERGEAELKLKNFMSPEKSHLKTELLPALKENVLSNLRFFGSVKVFEIGKVFYPKGNTIGERTNVACQLGHKEAGKNREVFYEIKGAAETLLNRLGISDVWFDDEPGKNARVMAGGDAVGHIHDGGFEFDFEKIVRLANEDYEYRQISRYPAVTRDIALFVPSDVRMAEVEDAIENSAGVLLVDSDLFDIYEPEGGDRISLAFHLVFQSSEKTLTDAEVNGIMGKVIKNLEERGWGVRK